MSPARNIAMLAIVVIGIAGAVTPARAEWSWDLYGGAAWLES